VLVAVTGATGLIGSALVRRLTADGHQVVRFTRSRPAGPDQAGWDPLAGEIDAAAVARADAVVHLAGKSIGEGLRWTARTKEEILQSRVRGTRLVAETMAVAAAGGGPRVLVCASGIGYYGSRGDEVLTEASPGGEGFTAELVRRWEAAADPARAAGLRVVHLRTAPVQSSEGGSLPRLLRLFRLGLGGRLGSGRQWWSWISLDDTVGAYLRALLGGDLEGPVNACAPNPVTNAEFTATLARVLRRPAFLAVPKFGPRLLLGELADELLFVSQRVRPAVLQASGFAFRFPELEPALRATIGRRGRP
jgi:uncharacterized protein (TIGR01777 family)